jgi:hypothetical protein
VLLLLWAVSGLYLPKTAFAALANLQSGVLTLPKALPLAGKTFSSPKLNPPTL